MARKPVTGPRWVGAKTKAPRAWVLHAVWVTHNTEPGEVREGTAKCGVNVRIHSIGDQGGLDWDRLTADQTCCNCRREFRREGSA